MHRQLMAVAFLAVTALVSPAAHAAEEKTFPLGKGEALRVALPDGWAAGTDDHTPPTITLKAPTAKRVTIQITEVPGSTADASLKKAATSTASFYAPNSVEKKVTLEAVKGPAVRGYISSFTDSAAEPGEFRFVAAGNLASSKRTFVVTMLYNEKESTDHTAALAALRSIAVVADAAAKAPAADKDELRVKSPDGRWTLVIPGKWTAGEVSKPGDGKSCQLTAISEGGMMLSVFLEPEAKPRGDAQAAREFYLQRMKRNPLGMDHLKKEVVGQVATLEYDQGMGDFKPHNLNAYLAHAGIWVDVHVSKPDFDEKTDRAELVALVKGLKAVDDAAPKQGKDPAAKP